MRMSSLGIARYGESDHFGYKSKTYVQFDHALFDVVFINPLKEELGLILKNEDVACFIFEPIVQGVAGMKVHSAEALDECLELCHQHGVITIADEVMTGFGRTGPILP